jgi:hypothetical protein
MKLTDWEGLMMIGVRICVCHVTAARQTHRRSICGGTHLPASLISDVKRLQALGRD